jgi:GTP cyclohydrolase I
MEKLIRQLLEDLGENPDREGLTETPKRVAESLKFLTRGMRVDPREILGKAVFTERYDEMVVLKDIDVYSLCEHHLLPFYGKCHVAYLPSGKIVGLSKIPRVVDALGSRLQVQERLTTEIAEVVMDVLRPLGVGVIIEARHLCMIMRGVEKLNTIVTTSALFGAFRDDADTRSEFLKLMGRSRVEIS